MTTEGEALQASRKEDEEPRRRLEEAEQTLDAIRSGEVDSFLGSGSTRWRVPATHIACSWRR